MRDVHTLAGAYVMDAISGADRTRFERHMAGCAECAEEVASLRETAARLGSAAATIPPPGLKERVMAGTAATRQEPPVVEGARRLSRIRSGLSMARPRRLAAVVVVAIVVVVAVGLAGTRRQLDQARNTSQQVAAVLTAGDARMMTGRVAGGGTATVVMSHSRDALVFTAAGLPLLSGSQGYELWLIGPAGERPAGMLHPGSHGMTGPVVATGLRPGDHLALTIEPGDGTRRPTTRMMLDVTLLFDRLI
jgi:anti-sigma-K factor RskA